MEQTSFGSGRRLDNVFKISWLVLWDFLLSVPITSLCNEYSSIDNYTTKVFKGLFKSGDCFLGNPNIRAQVMREVFCRELGGRYCAFKGRVDIEGTIRIIRAFEGIDLAIFESLFPTRPASQKLCGWVLELGCLRSEPAMFGGCDETDQVQTVASFQGKKNRITCDAGALRTRREHHSRL